MEKTKEESLTNVNNQSLIEKIKMFFQKIVGKNNKKDNINNIEIEKEVKENTEDNSFKESIKKATDEQSELLELQKKFRNGQIKDGDLSQEQIDKLCMLYDMQIHNLKISIEMRKKRIEEYRKKNKKV